MPRHPFGEMERLRAVLCMRGDDTEQAALRSVRIASSSAGRPPSAEGALPTLMPRLVEERRGALMSSHALPTGFARGRYQVTALLGEGASKRVYLAHDTRLERDVAIAVIRTEGPDEARLARVRREAQAMARLGDHPHIVSIHDVGDEGGRPYIVTQYMAGGSLDDLLRRAVNRPGFVGGSMT